MNADYTISTLKQILAAKAELTKRRLPSPSDLPFAWDTVYLGSIRLPGLCKVKVDLSNELQKAKAKGKNGCVTTFLGTGPASLSVKSTLHGMLEGTADFANALAVFEYLLEHRDTAFEISHPLAKLMGISMVFVEKISGEHNAQELEFTYSLSQFTGPAKPAASVTKTPTAIEPRHQVLGPDLPVNPAKPSKSGAALP